MNGELLALGVSHKTAPLPVRERLALPDARAARVLAELTAKRTRADLGRLRRELAEAS